MIGKAIDGLKNYDKKDMLLFGYHLLFILIAYKLRVDRGISDAHLYWGKSIDINQHSWFDFANYGTNFILFLNYPFIKLGLPFWFGFLMYGIIGFLGIRKFMDWAFLVFGKPLQYKGFNLLYLVFFLPNLHFWTASLGKEALLFWGIASVFYAMASHNYKTFSFVVGSLLVLIIRPHVALMLLAAIALIVLFDSKYSLKKRIAFFTFALVFLSMLLYMVFQLSNIRYWNWERITYFNEYSILSFKGSGTYVPMLEYNYFYKLFSFNFRPLFFDSINVWTFFGSIENCIVLLLHGIALFFVVKFYAKITFGQWLKIVFLFTFIASLLYVQRYANLGIFMRTKMMFQPFMMIALLFIIKQGIAFKNLKD
ncbi:hypothetical protein [Flavobacterium sangjuense]|uniref:Glycosyltransferase RgtA/B/C/D-like domain-containing protein n=1 Tax=Flavobacterium sangjuense TaxID=2518177 RepID=A0A4P7PSH5_9FLAO|nr:hypothetical protein [Flavobacterium sangjuense]QBZ97878.1 hypothetical protein GS03_01376 [Flavobacterium sangjuense]